MGEVYRADDLTLGQPVALKFLPEVTSGDEEMLARLRGEVRIARRVSHPNVCRVYDVGEAEGLHFLSMEYVDGEDLASLLRRIGRLPRDKAAEMARGVCAGLAAAHEKGVLHRDLKPANVMLDSQGQVVLTDFGLAALADQVAGTDLRSGTPAYMSPEQLDNRDVTARSDIYALGLLLYEMFTGKRAFEARTFAEAVRSRREATPSNPSSLVADLPPTLDRVILRCLERDPANRPPSAHAVALALPGRRPPGRGSRGGRDARTARSRRCRPEDGPVTGLCCRGHGGRDRRARRRLGAGCRGERALRSRPGELTGGLDPEGAGNPAAARIRCHAHGHRPGPQVRHGLHAPR
jgi:serine/threonine-protein kinase